MRILVVEDNDRLARSLVAGLRQHGYDVHRVATAEAALAAAPGTDVVLLDLGLPDADGIEVCRRLREFESVAVIAVTARGSEHDRIVGLRSGADDYVVKPFSLGELAARIEAVARRTRPARATRPEAVARSFGDLVIDPGARAVTVAGVPVALTRKEFDLLEALAAHPGRVCTREALLDQVWRASWETPSRTLDVHIAALRAKLGDAVTIETLRGVGYRLRA